MINVEEDRARPNQCARRRFDAAARFEEASSIDKGVIADEYILRTQNSLIAEQLCDRAQP